MSVCMFFYENTFTSDKTPLPCYISLIRKANHKSNGMGEINGKTREQKQHYKASSGEQN